MSPETRYKRSRDNWKRKAGERAGEIRYGRKQLARVKKERDQLKKELKEANSRLCQLETQIQSPVVQDKVDLVFLTLQLSLVARISFRAVSRVLGVLTGALGIKKAPSPQTIINWVRRLALVRIQAALVLKGPVLERAPFCNGWIWMIDISIGLGTGKILTVLALNVHHHKTEPDPPGFKDVRCVAVCVAESWTGEAISALLKRLIAVLGRPAAYLKDAGTDLHKSIRLLDEQGLGSLSIDDISHVIANLLKRWYHDHPMFETFLSTCSRVAGNLKQTILACLTPPKVRTKARFMNLHRLIAWADRLLKLSPPGGARKGSVLSKLRACMDGLPACRSFIRQFQADAVPLLECEKILKTRGLSHSTLAECEPFIQAIPSGGVRQGFQTYLQEQLGIATALGLEKIGMPITSDPLESLYGLGKQHGTGQIKDADQIAKNLPAHCGIPTRAEAEQVLALSVADQYELTGPSSSLVKQRREVLPNPDRLESLGTNQARTHVELIPRAKNRSNCSETVDLSTCYHEAHDPELRCQTG